MNAFRRSVRRSLYTAKQIKKLVGTVKMIRTMEMIVVKKESDIGGGTSEQSFSKSVMAKMLGEFSIFPLWHNNFPNVLRLKRRKYRRQLLGSAIFETLYRTEYVVFCVVADIGAPTVINNAQFVLAGNI